MKPSTRRPARTPDYAPPLDRLLALGNPSGDADRMWRNVPLADYAAMGLSVDNADELIRLASDPWFNVQQSPQCYAPIHAFRALAALGCTRAIPAMLRLVEKMDKANEDGWLEDVPGVLAVFGPAAIGPVAAAWRDQRTPFGARLFIGDALERIALKWSEHRSTVVGVFAETLKLARYTDPGINGHAISSLVALNAVESLPAIRSVMEAGLADETVCGNIKSVEQDIRLTAEERAAATRAMIDAIEADPNSPLNRLAAAFGQASVGE